MQHFLDSNKIGMQHAVRKIRCTEVFLKKSANYPAYEGRNCPQSGSNKEQAEIMTGFCVSLAHIRACQGSCALCESPEFVVEIK